jgi:hypothetical protein
MTTLSLYRGDAFKRSFSVKQADKTTPYNLTGCTLWFTVKAPRDRSGDDSNALIKCSWKDGGTSNGITVTTLSTGVAAVYAGTALTSLLQAERAYPYDVQLVDINGDPWTLDIGTLSITDDVTIRVTTP